MNPLPREDIYRSQLFQRLYVVAERLRYARFLQARRRLAVFAAGGATTLAVLAWLQPAWAAACLYGIFIMAAGSVLAGLIRYRRVPLDFAAAAREIEQDHPELDQSLITAVQENMEREPSFLGRLVAQQALSHESAELWSESGRPLLMRQRLAYLGSLLLLLALMGLSYFAAQREIAPVPAPPRAADLHWTISPGDTEIERGSSLVVTARYEGTLPSQAILVVVDDSGRETRRPMNPSLSDPIFAHALQRVDDGLRYRVETEGSISDSYRVDVYDLPELVRADAALDFPEYTGWRDRAVEHTTRISAIEGTRVDLTFNLNKPVAEAYLESGDSEVVALQPDPTSVARFTFGLVLDQSQRYRLQLVDQAGRRNAFPPEIRLDALPNKRPELRLSMPKGDQRPTSLEEIVLVGEATDDFGLLDYGVAFHVADREVITRSLAERDDSAEATRPRSASIRALLALEPFELEPREVVSWYLWADDHDPQGQPRRSTGDLFFADIRPFDETFREQDAGASQGQQAGGGQGEELIEIQRRISISLFRIKNNESDAFRAREDLEVLQNSQRQAMNQLDQMSPLLQDPADRLAAATARGSMDAVIGELTTAIQAPALDPLDPAWTHAQAAYQSLLRLASEEFNVARGRNQGGSGAGRSANQRQLDELEFRQAENRYETATRAQPLASPEQLQDLQLLARLNELSRRQQDLNQQLQEMQSALAEAQNEEERRRIERELKRLEEEQREMLQAADQAIQQAGNRQRSREARERLENARDDMRRANEQLQRGEVSQSLASGTRAQGQLDETRESLRNQASSQFSEAMRTARQQAAELAERQQALEEELETLSRSPAPRLDDGEERQALAQALGEQQQNLQTLLEELQGVTEGSEASEPGLYRRLYDILRSQTGARYDERYETAAQLLQQGFTQEASETQEGLTQALSNLSDQIATAAETVLGDETTTLRYAEQELQQLQEQLSREQGDEPGSREGVAEVPADGEPGRGESSAGDGGASGLGAPPDASETAGEPGQGVASFEEGSAGAATEGGGGGGGSDSLEARFREGLSGWDRRSSGPITGGGYSEWIDRLRVVESLMESPEAREQLGGAREAAEQARREFKRHGNPPQWEMLQDGIAAPLERASRWVRQELARKENPDTLQPIDRDPVPQEYSEAVRRYYESLGNE